MISWVLLIIAGLSRLPPNFPELPSNYTEWEYIHSEPEHIFYPLLPRLLPPLIKMKAHNINSVALSFNIEVPDFKKDRVASDTTFDYGYARYSKSPTASSAFGHIEGGLVYVFWRLSQKDTLNRKIIRNYLIYGLNLYNLGLAKLALNKAGVEEVIISNRLSFRLRAMWWQTQCDGGIHEVGSATCYFVPTEEDEKHDFIILCLTRTYHRSPPFAPLMLYTQEESDSIIANWEYEKTYPNNIADLERAVEQTFRVK